MTNTQQSPVKPLILLGAGGHAKVLFSLIRSLKLPVLGICAPELVKNDIKSWRGLDVLGNGDDLKEYSPEEVDLVNCVGQRVDNDNRRLVFERFVAQNYYFPVLIHPNAWVDSFAVLEEGVQVMAGVVIQPDARIGKNAIINSQSSIDHDCIIGEHVHIAPGAVLCGTVTVAKGSFIATGARIAPGIKIGESAIIGAGVSVVRDVKPKSLVLPAAVRYIDSDTDFGEK
ncbi:acetyltransferase [Legionella fallonii]|uniref:Sugar O-acyltransferase, sialic acid O-acetyltransferase NeuD family n=1 Tax=Legionella fallonii LLAP-10 TaxID=1212491 RepID=A0A098G1A1_9GAMM|nr:acetyltransferase [Legionella fallonii]CEG56247.1 Sugar O-acyltransferase, sialic acid O-acetyltransferase NeuD family [Legionella fallonii LLAP-10]